MVYSTDKLVAGREPFFIVDLELEKCSLTFSSAPCTATGSGDAKCQNTYKTCQDTANFTTTADTVRLIEKGSNVPIGLSGYPCLVGKPSIAPTKLTPGEGIGHRGSFTVTAKDFAHHDRGRDPYVDDRTYDPLTRGSFFGKLLARSPYYTGRLMNVYVCYNSAGFAVGTHCEKRAYIIDRIDGPDKDGNVNITGKDILKLADDKRAQAPAPSTGTLSADYTAGGSTLVLQAGEGSDYNTDPYTGSAISTSIPGYVRVGDNILKYTGVSTDTLTGIVGGQFGTNDEAADISDLVQQCLYYNAVNVVDVLDDLLKTYAGIAESYIPYDQGRATPTGLNDEWDKEYNSWLDLNNLTRVISEPTGVTELLAQITDQNMIHLWPNEVDQEIKLKAIAPDLRNQTPPAVNDTSNVLRDSVKVIDRPDDRISRVYVHYGIRDATGDVDDPKNYRYEYDDIDLETEGADAYDAKRVKVIYGSWLNDATVVAELAGRLLSRYKETPKKLTFALDPKDSDIWTGDEAVISTQLIQGADGANLDQQITITSVKETEPGHRNEYEAIATVFNEKKVIFIAPDATLAYTSEDAADQLAYGYIGNASGEYSNGDTAHTVA